ncbi:hypothetical protein GGR57DRAFT_35767 [Xylariaceae sp. FL1272]|nr:hypothetical protein GGR57DRAFT_35767 [Xylariaceae sp. FL1272]
MLFRTRPKVLSLYRRHYGRNAKEFVVDIKGTGRGIHPDDQGRIFEPYEKIDQHSTGAGLGLTLTEKFASLLHGSMGLVASEPGLGAHFRVVFHEVECLQTAFPQHQLVSKLEHLPSNVWISPSNSTRACSFHLGQYLMRQGFTSVDKDTEHSFTVLELQPDVIQFRTLLSQRSPSRIIICVVPAAGVEWPFEAPQNVVFVRDPFTATSLSLAVKKADEVAGKIKVFADLTSQINQLSSVTSLDEVTPNSDVAIITPPQSPPLSGSANPTLNMPMFPSIVDTARPWLYLWTTTISISASCRCIAKSED